MAILSASTNSLAGLRLAFGQGATGGIIRKEQKRKTQMIKKEYNGWTNYETWLVKLWIDNDEGSYAYWREETQRVYDAAEACDTFTKAEQAALDLDDELKAWHEEIIEQAGVPANGFIADLLGAAMSEVNWHEIAVSLIEGNVEEETAES